MFATFKLDPQSFSNGDFQEYYDEGKQMYDSHERIVSDSLNSYLLPGGALSASEIEKNWFPEIKADVFLSHSHEDEKYAIAFAGFLKSLNLTAFVDSCVWGYANDLLKKIDDKYCVSEKNSDDNINSYDYAKRNQSTAHVHMILNGALMKMINQTECLIFMDTPNSLATRDVIQGATNSGWIYSELLMSRYIERKSPYMEEPFQCRMDESLKHSELSVKYDVDISHLTRLSIGDIKEATNCDKNSGTDVLDQLYRTKKYIMESNKCQRRR